MVRVGDIRREGDNHQGMTVADKKLGSHPVVGMRSAQLHRLACSSG